MPVAPAVLPAPATAAPAPHTASMEAVAMAIEAMTTSAPPASSAPSAPAIAPFAVLGDLNAVVRFNDRLLPLRKRIGTRRNLVRETSGEGLGIPWQ